jgi:hypothetical protein
VRAGYLAFHPPAGDRIERRRTYRLARARAEAGMMPRVADSIAGEQPLRERTTVMCARGQQSQILPHGVRASAKILGEKEPAGTRRVARNFAMKHAILTADRSREPEVDCVKHTRPAATPPRFLLCEGHHSCADFAAS